MGLVRGAKKSKYGFCDFVIICVLWIWNAFQICASLLIAVKKLFLKKLVVHSSIPRLLRINMLYQTFHLLTINLTYSWQGFNLNLQNPVHLQIQICIFFWFIYNNTFDKLIFSYVWIWAYYSSLRLLLSFMCFH